MVRLKIPKSEKDISLEWMQQALEAGGLPQDLALIEANTRKIGSQMGYTALNYRCNLTYSDLSSDSVIVKAPSSIAKTVRICEWLHLYKRECFFYQNIAPTVQIQTPALLFAQIDDLKSFVIVMEDLGHLRSVDQIEGASEEQARKVIQTVAAFHGMFWNKIDLPQLSPLHETRKVPNVSLQFFYMLNLANAFKRFGVFFSTELVEFTEQLGMRLSEFINTLDPNPKTLVHGDYRLDNMFFCAKGSNDLYVIDWQGLSFSCGLQDVAYFLSFNVTTKLRRKIERELVREYHDILCKSGKLNNFSFEECWRIYRQYILLSYAFLVVVAGGLKLNGPRSTSLVKTAIDRLYAAIQDLDVYEFMPGRPRLFSVSSTSSTLLKGVYLTSRVLK